METLHERLAYAREKAGYTSPRAFAMKHGLVYNTYLAHERGGRGAPNKTVEQYARLLGVNYLWLLTGAGVEKDVKYSQPQKSGGMSDGDYTGSYYEQKSGHAAEVARFLNAFEALGPMAKKAVLLVLAEEIKAESAKKNGQKDNGGNGGAVPASGHSRQK